MFHLKFQSIKEDEEAAVNISCELYQVLQRKEIALIVIPAKGHLLDGGTEYAVSGADRDFDVCFVTNDIGKTVDRVGPFKKADNQVP